MLDAVDRRTRDNIWCPSEFQGDDDSDSYDYNDDGAAAATTDVASFSTSSSSKVSSGGGSSSSSRSSNRHLCQPCLGIRNEKRGEEHALEKQVRKVGGKKRPADDVFIDLVTPDASDDEGNNGGNGGRSGGNISGSARAVDLDADRALAEALQKDMNNNEDRDRALAEVIQREINDPAVFGGTPRNS
jgi:hypothetical protein